MKTTMETIIVWKTLMLCNDLGTPLELLDNIDQRQFFQCLISKFRDLSTSFQSFMTGFQLHWLAWTLCYRKRVRCEFKLALTHHNITKLFVKKCHINLLSLWLSSKRVIRFLCLKLGLDLKDDIFKKCSERKHQCGKSVSELSGLLEVSPHRNIIQRLSRNLHIIDHKWHSK